MDFAMSLINKLLQDLEQRQAGTESNMPISAGVQSVHRAPRRGGWMIAAMLLLPVVAAAGLWTFLSKGPVPAATVAQAPVAVAPAPVAVAPAPAPTPAPVVAVVETKPEVAKAEPAKVEAPKVEVAKVEVAKAPAPVVAPAAKAPAPVVAKAAVDAPVVQPEKVPPPPAPKTVTAAVEKPKAVVAQASTKPEGKPEPKAELKPEPKALTDAKIAGMYPGVIKKNLNDPAAAIVASADKPAAAAPSAADRPVAKLAVAAEPQSQKTFTPRQQSDNLYKQAVVHAQQGQGKDARDLLAKSLEAAPQNVAARQMLAGLLVEANKLPDALGVLREGVKVSPDNSAMWMNLARLQLEFGDANAATATLEQGLTPAGEDAQYNAFYAVLMQRAGRHDAALKHYLVALRSDPSMPNWLVGAGISMQALGRDSDAIEAFQRAKDGGQLPAAFTSFVDQRLAQLKR
jgi:MSHA biogenesis protein MshN